jgi:hypothetical protein
LAPLIEELEEKRITDDLLESVIMSQSDNRMQDDVSFDYSQAPSFRKPDSFKAVRFSNVNMLSTKSLSKDNSEKSEDMKNT